MPISVFHLFTIGVGPSSSHTVGPMRAARMFAQKVQEKGLLPKVSEVKIDLFGSRALTGKGHGTDFAVMLGLEGETPEDIDPNAISSRIKQIQDNGTLNFLGCQEIVFHEPQHLLFHKDRQLPAHPNGMRFTVYDEKGDELFSHVYYSVGGGFIVDHEQFTHQEHLGDEGPKVPFLFYTAGELIGICEKNNKTIDQVVVQNEKTWRSEPEIHAGLMRIWKAMQECAARGCSQEGILPGGLGVKRRAAGLLKNLQRLSSQESDPDLVMKWVSLWALAVNEENAAGGRVVTAPTNGASGVIPAVLHYLCRFTKHSSDESVRKFLLTAGAIGILYKFGASISAAEMGCMGEVGVACSMAAAGLTAALGGSIYQIENAAEIGMEHNLGLTCDPVKGLVQIPCIERNTMGAIKAINAALLALNSDGKSHRVSLDQVIAAMRQTGKDMSSIYKETSLGGLAVNVPEC